MTDTQWGRKETIVRPPHYPVYSFGAVFVALVLTVPLRRLHLAFRDDSAATLYLPLCYAETGFLAPCRRQTTTSFLRSPTASITSGLSPKPTCSQGRRRSRIGKPIPLALSDQHAPPGLVFLYRGTEGRVIANRPAS